LANSGEDRDSKKNFQVGLEKYALASEFREAGYQIQAICATLGLSRASFYRWRRRPAGAGFRDLKYLGSRDPAADVQILARIKEIKLSHPFWGYRRVRLG